QVDRDRLHLVVGVVVGPDALAVPVGDVRREPAHGGAERPGLDDTPGRRVDQRDVAGGDVEDVDGFGRKGGEGRGRGSRGGGGGSGGRRGSGGGGRGRRGGGGSGRDGLARGRAGGGGRRRGARSRRRRRAWYARPTAGDRGQRSHADERPVEQHASPAHDRRLGAAAGGAVGRSVRGRTRGQEWVDDPSGHQRASFDPVSSQKRAISSQVAIQTPSMLLSARMTLSRAGWPLTWGCIVRLNKPPHSCTAASSSRNAP